MLFCLKITYEAPYGTSDVRWNTLYNWLPKPFFRDWLKFTIAFQKIKPFLICQFLMFQIWKYFWLFNLLSIEKVLKSWFYLGIFLFLTLHLFLFLCNLFVNYLLLMVIIYSNLIPFLVLFFNIFGLFLYYSQEIVFIDLPLLFFHLMHVIFDDSPLLILFNRYFTHHRNCYSCWLMLLIPIFAFIQNYLFNFFFFKLVV